MLSSIIEAGAYIVVDTGLFPNPDGVTLQLRFRKISPAEAAEAEYLVRVAMAVGGVAGVTAAKAAEIKAGLDFSAEAVLSAIDRTRKQAVEWCRGASIDGGKSWKPMRLTLDEAEQDTEKGPLYVDLFPSTLWPMVVTRVWSEYTLALTRVSRFQRPTVPTPGGDEPAAGKAAG